jgi:hypothetical protein
MNFLTLKTLQLYSEVLYSMHTASISLSVTVRAFRERANRWLCSVYTGVLPLGDQDPETVWMADRYYPWGGGEGQERFSLCPYLYHTISTEVRSTNNYVGKKFLKNSFSCIWNKTSIFICPSKDGTYYVMALSVRPAGRPGSFTVFRTFFFFAIFAAIGLKLGVLLWSQELLFQFAFRSDWFIFGRVMLLELSKISDFFSFPDFCWPSLQL